MAEYMTLMGAEQVQSAARQMQSAASDMQRAAGEISHALQMHQRWADDWLQQLRDALEGHTLGVTKSG